MHRLPFTLPAGLLLGLALAAPAPAVAQTATPKPAVAAATFAERLERALTRTGCPGLATLNKYGQIRLPCPSRSNRRIKAAFRGFKVRGTRTYGTGAVIDFTSGEAPRGGSYVLLLSAQRRWSIVFAPITNRRTTRDALGSSAGHQNAANGFTTAVRDGSCDGYFRFAVTPPGQRKTQACSDAFGANGLYTGLQADLRANPGVTPALLGGNRTFAFFALRTGSTYRTAATLRTGRGAAEPFLVITTERV
jgi:hypothetical protein